MTLTATRIKNAKPREKAYKLYDQRGLFLLVKPGGSKLWRFRYRHCGREKLISLGPYPEVSLATARDLTLEQRATLREGRDPSHARQALKNTGELQAATFESIAKEWFSKFAPTWAVSHSSKVIRRLERDIFPYLGNRPIGEVTARELLVALRKIEARGAIETAHRAKQNCGQILRYAIANGLAERDISQDLKGAIAPPLHRHLPSVKTPTEVGALLRAIDGYKGGAVTGYALRLAPLVFVRPGELRSAEWDEISLSSSVWRIPAHKMKTRSDHIVPLSMQAKSLIKELAPVSSASRFLFPSIRTHTRCMSENTLNAALRRLGYDKREMTAPGFRSMASTLLNEMGWNPDAIERQLSHKERNSIRAAYNHAEHLPVRRKMMQAWADYLDELRVPKPTKTNL